jgi:hypothetical protein
MKPVTEAEIFRTLGTVARTWHDVDFMEQNLAGAKAFAVMLLVRGHTMEAAKTLVEDYCQATIENHRRQTTEGREPARLAH